MTPHPPHTSTSEAGEWTAQAGEPTTLADCPVGLFVNEYGGLCTKTEYGNNEGRIDAYIVDSGEFFWGSAPQTIESQRRQIVRPVSIVPAPSTQEPTSGEWVMREALLACQKAEQAEEAALEITERADAEGWLNDPTGSMHVAGAYDKASKLRAKAAEMRDAALAAPSSPPQPVTREAVIAAATEKWGGTRGLNLTPAAIIANVWPASLKPSQGVAPASKDEGEGDLVPVAWDLLDEGGPFCTTHRLHVAEENRVKGYRIQPLYPESALLALRAEIERLTKDVNLTTERRNETAKFANALTDRLTASEATIAGMREALKAAEAVLTFADEGYANPDVNHEDYRIRVAQAANEYFQERRRALDNGGGGE